MSRLAKTPYKTTNWHSYNQALRQRGSLTAWFDPSMQWEAAPSARRGRQQAYSDAAIQACLTPVYSSKSMGAGCVRLDSGAEGRKGAASLFWGLSGIEHEVEYLCQYLL